MKTLPSIMSIGKNLTALPGRYRTFGSFIVIALLAACALGANPFAGETVAPFDLLLSYQGWSSVQAGVRPLNTQPSDILDSLLPVWVMLKEQLREGKGVLWYPYGAGGVPISLDLGNPSFWLFALIRDNAFAWYLVGLAKLVVSGFGAYLLLRTFLRRLPSLWGGAVYMLCGFNAAWFYWDQVTTAMWIPWLFWATVRFLTTEDARWLPAISLSSLLLIFGGFPAVAAFGFYAFSLLLLIWIACERVAAHRQGAPGKGNRSVALAGKAVLPLLAVGLAFLMSAVTLVPFAENMGQINLSYRSNAGSSFDGFRDLLLFLTWETPLAVERTAYLGWPAVLLALAGIVAAFRSSDGLLGKLNIVMVALLLLGVAVLFGPVPPELVRSLPVFGSNHWSRMIVIPLLALSVLSATGLERAITLLRDSAVRFGTAPERARLAVTAVVLAVMATQFILQKNFFNAYNAVVPSAWFYPQTPAIRQVQDRIGPLESVIADSSFMVAGTLGAYGIPEWYAHAYRTDREKSVLEKLVHEPFASPTAAFIHGSDIRLDSPLMDQLAIRFLLLRRDWRERRVLLSMPEFAPVPAPSLTDGPWKQRVYLQEDVTIGAFGFQFLTGGTPPASGEISLSLYSGDGRKYSAEPTLSGQDIADDQWSFFEFPGKVVLPRGPYLLVLTWKGWIGGALSARASRLPLISGTYLERDGRPSGVTLNMQIGAYEQTGPPEVPMKWTMLDAGENIVVLENRNVHGGAYHVGGLDASKDMPDFSGIEVSRPSANHVSVEYDGSASGWVVLPMHLHAGWKAYVDGRRTPYDTYLDILPAIPVKGPARIEFRYEPDSITKGAALSGAGSVLFLAGTVFCFRAVRKRPFPYCREKGERS